MYMAFVILLWSIPLLKFGDRHCSSTVPSPGFLSSYHACFSLSSWSERISPGGIYFLPSSSSICRCYFLQPPFPDLMDLASLYFSSACFLRLSLAIQKNRCCWAFFAVYSAFIQSRILCYPSGMWRSICLCSFQKRKACSTALQPDSPFFFLVLS